jgi:hypothetical protein
VTVTITPTDADFDVACSKRFADGKAAWASLKREATKAAAQRLLADNAAWRARIIAQQSAVTGPAFLRNRRTGSHWRGSFALSALPLVKRRQTPTNAWR